MYAENLSNYSERSSRLKWLRRFAYLLDNSLRIPGTEYRVGIDPLLGLIPGVGDAVGGILSALIVAEAYRLGAPKRLLLRMAYNVGLEVLIGTVPIAGDVFDAAWKSNLKNINLLDEYLNSLKTRKPFR